ncbi:hypothetical protein Mapa_009178 [Marchantia paleacea]|nr:hypothetical protein Mapa_009178 [Marchantia paleacea]
MEGIRANKRIKQTELGFKQQEQGLNLFNSLRQAPAKAMVAAPAPINFAPSSITVYFCFCQNNEVLLKILFLVSYTGLDTLIVKF